MFEPRANRFPNLIHNEDGAVTILGLFILLAVMMIGGLALDLANASRVRTQLQVASDAAAHAALVVRELHSENEAVDAALRIAATHLPSDSLQAILRPEDIVFGDWDAETETFTADSSSRDAVLMETGRAADRYNSVSTYLLRFAGIDHFDVRRRSVFETYIPICFREGMVAELPVDVTTNNLFKKGFCVHSNTYVEMNTGNIFEAGTIVSMPSREDLVIPDSGFESNPGLYAALRDGSYELRVLQRVNKYIEGVRNPNSPYFRDYILTGASEVPLNRTDKLDDSAFTSHRIHTITCTASNQQAKIHAGTALRDIVLWTNCQLFLGENVTMENVTIVNENTGVKSVTGASGIQIGRDDHCAAGGGAQIVTKGGIDFPQYIKMYGGQMIAVGNISYTSDADGIEGAAIVSGGSITGTSDGVMAFCGGEGMENNFEAQYFRLAL